jgi:hypothetical protein
MMVVTLQGFSPRLLIQVLAAFRAGFFGPSNPAEIGISPCALPRSLEERCQPSDLDPGIRLQASEESGSPARALPSPKLATWGKIRDSMIAAI